MYFKVRFRYIAVAIFLLVLNAVMGVAEVWFPILMGNIIDSIESQDFAAFRLYALMQILLLLAYPTVYVWGDWIEAHLKFSMVKDIVVDSSREVLKKDMRILGESGYVVSRLYDDSLQAISGILENAIGIAYTLGLLVWGALVIIRIHASLALFFLIAILILQLFSTRLYTSLNRLTLLLSEKEAILKDFLLEFLKAYQIVRNITGFNSVLKDALISKVGETFGVRLSLEKRKSLVSEYASSSVLLSVLVAMVVGSIFVLRGDMGVGQFVTFYATLGLFARYVGTLANLAGNAVKSTGYMKRLRDFLRPERPYYRVGEEVVLKDVSVSYNGKPVLKGVNFHMRRGDRIRIVGANGSGKTTLANVLSGILAPESGEVVLPSSISFITHPFHFPNLQVNYLIDYETAQKFGLTEAYRTPASDLSAGQKARLALALALSRDADLYVLDEPLANLDAGAKEYFLNKILERTEGKSLILISHEKVGGLKEVGMDTLQN